MDYCLEGWVLDGFDECFAGTDFFIDFVLERDDRLLDLLGDGGKSGGHEEDRGDESDRLGGVAVLHSNSFRKGCFFYYSLCKSCEPRQKERPC